MITREIIYRLLQGEQSERLRHIAVLNGQSHRIAEAVRRLRQNFDESIQVETLAEEFGMSQSSFYQHFKDFTGMTPLQFQKQLRLQEARRLMLGEDLNASTAGYQVGYDDPSHFSREYKRQFGRPPMRDVELLKETKTAPTE
jgi:AraC-like DNA-binding protein